MKYTYERFYEEVKNGIKKAIKKIYGIEYEVKIEKQKVGDASFACFSLSKEVKKSPIEIAEEISKSIEGNLIKRVEAINGYVNFYIDEEKLAEETLNFIDEMGENFGSFEKKGKRVIVEHTSANPNGPLHVGRARNPIIGDTIARLLKFGGYEVVTQYYVDDMGKQVAILFWGVKNLRIEEENKKMDHIFVEYYKKAFELMEKEEKVKNEINEIVRRCERGDKKILEEIREVYEKVLSGIKESLENINIRIDEFVEESRFVIDGSVEKLIREISGSDCIKEEENAFYLDLTSFNISGMDNKFFLTRSDGTSLYPLRDVAYHIWKGERADIMINVLGEDHKLEAKCVEIILKILNKKTPENIFYAFVSLPEGKMSTRRGRVIYLDDLFEEAIERAKEEVKKRRKEDESKIEYIARNVAVGAIRYNIIKVKPDKAIVFKWEEALNFEGESAPFIQYAHARCCSILRKAKYEKLRAKYEHSSEIELIKTIAYFPEIVKESIENRNPSIIAEYAYKLASRFNIFYRDCRVIGSEKEKERIAIVNATRQVLKNCLNLLGIEALEEM
ncbi:MAG: arginine--tRNA ligase [Thermoplasmatales archaeon]|nr:arginine--tRNA ligase [Thermoplasmatales archaeon]